MQWAMAQRAVWRPVSSRVVLRARVGVGARRLVTEVHAPSGPATSALLDELKYLDEDGLRARFDEIDVDGNGVIDVEEAKAMLRSEGRPVRCAESIVRGLGRNGRIGWTEFKAAAEAAATPVDARVRPIYATLTLTFIAQGIQFPVLPQLARSLELSTADLGVITASTSLARLLCNVPAAMLAERAGRRPLLIAGPAIACVGMCALAGSTSLSHLVAANVAIGAGMATSMAGASNYLADISTPRNRSVATTPRNGHTTAT